MKLFSRFPGYRLAGHLMFAVLFILAALFYRERTLFVDPCYAVFNLFYYGDYVAEAGRHTAVIPQTFALWAIGAGLPLKAVLMIYSLSFVFLYYLIYLLIAHLFRLDRLALAIPLLMVTGIKYSFFWISTETHQALAWSVLFFAFLAWSQGFRNHPGLRAVRILMAAGIAAVAFYAHPVALFTLLFALGYFVVSNRLWKSPDAYLLMAVPVVLALVKFLTRNPAGYESEFFNGFADFFGRVGHVTRSGGYQFLRHKLFNIYLVPALLFILLVFFYILKKEYLKLGYFLVAFLLFALVLFTTFEIHFLHFIQEKNLMGLTFCLLIPFLQDVVPGTPGRDRILRMFLTAAFLIGIAHVAGASVFFRSRLDYIGEFVRIARQYPEKKFLIPESVVDRDRLLVNWALAPETLLLSSLEGPDSSVSVYINDNYGRVADTATLADTARFICAPWAQHHEIRRLDRRWFGLQGSAYRVLSERDLATGAGVSVYVNRFDRPGPVAGGDTVLTDSTGNGYLVTKSEFSPGLYRKYSEVARHPAILVTARVRIRLLEPADPKWLALAISRERNNTVYEYYRGVIEKPGTGDWQEVTVSGVVRQKDPGDQLKVYFWNPGKKRLAMDDLEVSYQVVQDPGAKK